VVTAAEREPLPVPEALLAAARAYADAGGPPAVPRDAATVLLLREAADGPEVYVMVRHRAMAFAPGVVAFPGGGVEPSDAIDLPAGWAERLGVDPPLAASVVAAALREVEEETGVVLGLHDLGLWDAWTTPEFEPRRYRTWFFTAALPAGQEPQELSTESASAHWTSARAALERVESGEWSMFPPTYWAMRRLETYRSVAEVRQATRTAHVEMFTPRLVGGRFNVPPWVAALFEDAG
jgi:8-oxo-dGTP pyrophosphatase MutT (NUDIX family)